MKTRRLLRIGYNYAGLNGLIENLYQVENALKREEDANARMMLSLADYLIKYSKSFHSASITFDGHPSRILSNGTMTGIGGLLNRSEIDIGFITLLMNEETTGNMDFCYPFTLYAWTFATSKPTYKPTIFSIFQTVSLPVWIAVSLALATILLVYYFALKSKYCFDKMFFHVIAVFLRQSSILRPSSASEKLLVYSWVVGAMFLCLAYDSVFLSFLAFAPVNNVRDISELAAAVENGDYDIISNPFSALAKFLSESEQKSFRIIRTNIETNKLTIEHSYYDFIRESETKNVALLSDVVNIQFLAARYFISEDYFFESMYATPVRKNFCCKKILDNFVHKMMASGLYFNYINDIAFRFGLKLLLKNP